MLHIRRRYDNRCIYISLGVGSVAVFAIGILIGYAASPGDTPAERGGLYLQGVSEALVKDGDPSISKVLMNDIRAENIRNNLKMLTDKPHLAGTEQNHKLALKIKEFWENAGLDHVTMTPYRVLLSYPDENDPNYVELLDENNNTQYKSDLKEPALTPEENKTDIVPPFNAYSAPGDIYGDLLYVNYGRVEDLEYLESRKNSIKGKIALARYGKIYRGNKVRLAELKGAIGVILFSDPADVTDGDINQVYPKDWWLPPSGTQRGTTYIGSGDPLTADYPAIETAYRKMDPDNYLSSIPCHPIGYGIAIHLMRNLGGEEVPEKWRGGMNVTYRFGNRFQANGWSAHMKVSTRNKNATIYNTIGIIKGNIEPDRYVLVGNHRDAWVFGAVDPSSGTAVMMEMSRVMGQLVKSGKWRPRRSILFCSWGAEEYGLIGSTEWVEHYTKSLGARATAYLNLDIATIGNYTLQARSTPLLYETIIKAAKKVSNPNDAEVVAGRNTVYDTWIKAFPAEKYGRPHISLPGSGSDYRPFRDRLGIPVLDMRFTYDRRLDLSMYPMYHSAYETFYLVDKIMDQGFKCHTAIAQIFMEITRDLSDSLVLPFNVSDYSVVLNDMADTLILNVGQQLNDNGVDTSLLQDAVANFTQAIKDFEEHTQKAYLKDPFVVRRINDQLMQLDRAFIDPAGLPGRRLKRHILFAPSSTNSYSGTIFPGLSDALSDIRLGKDVTKQWEVVHKHFSVILFIIQSAAGTLKDVTNFMFDY